MDGSPGTAFTDIELNPHDSLYVFVKVTIDPTAADNPFVVQDSVEINYNGALAKVYLEAYGQNARFITATHVTANTVWNNQLPYVVMNTFFIDNGVSLTIEKGTKVYCSANAAFVVNGSLKTMGEKGDTDRVVFRGSRLDAAYRDLPGTWPGLVFTSNSSASQLHYTSILNAYQAIAIGGASLVADHCIIHNAYDIGLYALNASVAANDCLISQCGNEGEPGVGGSNLILTGGGLYNFTHCTVATFGNYYQNHKQPVVFISNTDAGFTAPLTANFTNCILYGTGGKAEEELIVHKAASDQVIFTNTLYKVTNEPTAVFTDCIKNLDPLFDTINISRQEYNFHLRENSPSVAAGKVIPSPNVDLDGLPRPLPPAKPDMGCYQRR